MATMLAVAWRAAIAGAVVVASPSRGQVQPPPVAPAMPPVATPPAPGTNDETLSLRDAEPRLTVAVNIGAHGPYDFIVDTGSERTVVSGELANGLTLAPGPDVMVHSMTEVSRIATVILPGLRIGQRVMDPISAPVMARQDMGAAGILGVDTLQTSRVNFDFTRREMTITPSQRSEGRWPEGTIVVTARNRFGRLMLIDAAVDGQRVRVIVDSGSEVTVANSALRRALERRHRLGPITTITATSVTGGQFTADYAVAQLIRLGDAMVARLPIAFADVHPFRQLQLIDQPAMLLGMDALRLFNRVSIDFANRQVKLVAPESLRNGAIIRSVSVNSGLPPR